MKRISKLTVNLIFIASIIFATARCKTEVKPIPPPEDKTAPANVTELKAEVKGLSILLTWKDADDTDIFGYEVSYSGEKPIDRAVLKMEANTLFVTPGNEGVIISGLENKKNYTFTVKSMDINGNKSTGVTTESVEISLTENKPIKVEASLSTSELTNQNVTVNVDVLIKETDIAVKKIAYKKGFLYKLDDLLSEQSDATDITEQKSFEVSENGEYTIAAIDTDGRREITWITVSNIDKIAPQKVQNLYASYTLSAKKLELAWYTADSDTDHYLVSYSVDEKATLNDEKKTEPKFTLENIEADGKTYTFTVKAVDKAGNQSNAEKTSITPNNAPLISSIELDRKHIAYNDDNKTINVTVRGSNFNLIESQSNKTIVIQIVDSSGNIQGSTVYATIMAESNTATAQITAPTSSPPQTVVGTNYTVRAIPCGNFDQQLTATLNISEAASVSSITLSQSQISVDDVKNGKTKTVRATVTGNNFDVAGTITMQFYDSTSTAYGNPVTIEKIVYDSKTHSASFEKDIEIPATDDMYTLHIMFNGTEQSKTQTLQVYGSPSFTSFTIPNAGISKQFNSVTATVFGKNFKTPNLTEPEKYFSVSCETASITTDSIIKISSNSLITVTLKIPANSGTYKVTIKSGSAYCEGTFTVKDYKDYTAGKILLADGNLANSSSYTSIDTNNPPVAVVAGSNDYGAAFAVGLHQLYSNNSRVWAKLNTTGNETTFTDIVCNMNGKGLNATFTGDLYGGDNWDIIRNLDPDGAKDAATNYPAFHWANTYGTTYSPYLGGVKDGWYMPSIAELCHIFRDNNYVTINATLSVINKVDPKYADKSLIESLTSANFNFWSSSERGNSRAYRAYYSDSVDYWFPIKSTGANVLVIRVL